MDSAVIASTSFILIIRTTILSLQTHSLFEPIYQAKLIFNFK